VSARTPHAAVHAIVRRVRRIGTAVHVGVNGRSSAPVRALLTTLHRHRRMLVPAAIVLAVTTVGVLAVGAAVSAPTHASTPDQAARQAAAARADRSAHTRPGDPKAPAKKATAKKAKAPARKAAPKRAPAWVAPMARFTLSSCYGRRWGAMHQGLDFAMPAGTPIRAVGAGTVSAAGWTYYGYGISVVIDHGHGYLTHYAHVSKVFVHPGQKVRAGQVIALEGSTGHSTGPHLHFEVHRGMWRQFNPAPWLRSHGVKIGC
jgi:murein DD-endopeptidase MepM/ murein hydrolase activator NlpD